MRRFEHRRSIAVGILNGGDNLLNSGVYYLAAVLLGAWGWRATIASLGALYLVLAVLILWALRAAGGAAPPSRGARRASACATCRGATRGCGWSASTYALIYAFITSVQLHLHAYPHRPRAHARSTPPRILSTLTLVGAVGAPLFGWLAERSSARGALLVVVLGLARHLGGAVERARPAGLHRLGGASTGWSTAASSRCWRWFSTSSSAPTRSAA